MSFPILGSHGPLLPHCNRVYLPTVGPSFVPSSGEGGVCGFVGVSEEGGKLALVSGIAGRRGLFPALSRFLYLPSSSSNFLRLQRLRGTMGAAEVSTSSTEEGQSGNGVAVNVPSQSQAAAAPEISKQISTRLLNLKPTVFTKFSILAMKHNAVNLGQGFPNFDGPDFIKEAAIEAIKSAGSGKNQYARGYGIPPLNAAIAERFHKETGLKVNPEVDVTVTSGCTEAIAATMIGLINAGDEVILFSPFYDSYEATLAMVDAKIKPVTLRPPLFTVPEDELRAAFSSKTRAILVNTPHNPTGKVFSRKELELIAGLCKEHDVLAITDEVYDKLVFKGEHISLASLEGMYERTVTLNSLGKSFSLTGWKVGWAIAPADLSYGIRQAHSYLTFSTATPFQWGAIAALEAPDSYYADLIRDYATKKDILMEGLMSVGFEVFDPQGTYFVMADHTPFGFKDDIAFCEYLVKDVGVAAIPPSAFYHNPEDGKHLVRFAFCKDDDTLREAVRRLKANLKRPEPISS